MINDFTQVQACLNYLILQSVIVEFLNVMWRLKNLLKKLEGNKKLDMA